VFLVGDPEAIPPVCSIRTRATKTSKTNSSSNGGAHNVPDSQQTAPPHPTSAHVTPPKAKLHVYNDNNNGYVTTATSTTATTTAATAAVMMRSRGPTGNDDSLGPEDVEVVGPVEERDSTGRGHHVTLKVFVEPSPVPHDLVAESVEL
jgi:hypothetical protein